MRDALAAQVIGRDHLRGARELETADARVGLAARVDPDARVGLARGERDEHVVRVAARRDHDRAGARDAGLRQHGSSSAEPIT